MDDAHFIVLLWFAATIFFAVVIVALARKKHVPVSERLRIWAEQRKFAILEVEENAPLPWKIVLSRLFSRGYKPPVFRIVVRDEANRIREGWICFHQSLWEDSESVWWRHADERNT